MRPRLRFLPFLALLFLSGCVTESTNGDEIRFGYATWMPMLVLLGGIAAAPAGWFLRKQTDWGGWVLLFGGPLAAIFFAPSLFAERVRINNQGFDVRSGIWGMTANQSVAFQGLQSIRIATEHTGGRRGRHIDVLYFDGAPGGAKFPLNNDVKIEAGKFIVRHLASRGIPVLDQRAPGGP